MGAIPWLAGSVLCDGPPCATAIVQAAIVIRNAKKIFDMALKLLVNLKLLA